MKVGEGQKGTSKWWCWEKLGNRGCGVVLLSSALLGPISPWGLRAAAPAGSSSEPGVP